MDNRAADLKAVTHIDNVRLGGDEKSVVIIDQTKLPNTTEYLTLRTAEDFYDAIFELKVRGAPAIGICAAYGIAVLSSQIDTEDYSIFLEEFRKYKEYLNSSRPTAVNLSWALNRMEQAVLGHQGESVAQIKDFLGMEIDVPSGFIPQWVCYFSNIGAIDPAEAIMSVCCVLIIVVWGKINRRIPGSLIAILLATAAATLLNRFAGMDFATIGSKFPELASGLPMPKPAAPHFDYETVMGLVSPAFTIAVLCAVESLLAAMVADGVTGKKHDSNTELIGQGIANIVTPMFGGIPATGALARTMASINNGGKSPVTGIVHAVVLLLIYLFLMPYATYIPLSCLAAILVIVAYNMSEWRTFRYLLKADRADVAVLLITFFLTVVVDLTVAIEVGVLLAVVLFVKRVMETSSIRVLDDDHIAATEDDEVAGYIADDFGLIADSKRLGYSDEWLDKLIFCYKNAQIPYGIL